jgi:hypothetical protein
MLCVEDLAQNDWIYSVNNRNTWLGLDKSTGPTVQPAGCTSTYTNWYGSEGYDGSGNPYAVIWAAYGGEWADLYTHVNYYAYCACQKSPDPFATTACVEDAVQFENKCYEFSYPTTFTGPLCQAHCGLRAGPTNASMACVPDLATQDFLYNRRQATLFIGLTDLDGDLTYRYVYSITGYSILYTLNSKLYNRILLTLY